MPRLEYTRCGVFLRADGEPAPDLFGLSQEGWDTLTLALIDECNETDADIIDDGACRYSLVLPSACYDLGAHSTGDLNWAQRRALQQFDGAIVSSDTDGVALMTAYRDFPTCMTQWNRLLRDAGLPIDPDFPI
jgi:hypothetical protein